LAPSSRKLLEKLLAAQDLKKFSAFDGKRRFITVYTRTCTFSHMNPVHKLTP
jgi:hypothetical protein